MKTYFLLLFSFFVFPLNFFSQVYQYPEKFDRSYDLKPLDALYNFKQKSLPGLTLNQSNEYRVETMFNTQRMFDNNDVYLNWMEVEAYLYKIIDTLVPDEAFKSHTILVFLTQFDSPYAFSYDNGLLFVNIGMFAEFPNEACLAAALAAEIFKIRHETHYSSLVFTKHLFSNQTYQSWNNMGGNQSGNPISQYQLNLRKYAMNGKIIELKADSFAALTLFRAGYDSRAVLTAWKVRENLADAYKYRLSPQQAKSYDQYRAGSPEPNFKQRTFYVHKVTAMVVSTGKTFLVDSAFYCKMHKIAKQEIKRKLFENGDYYSCMQRCFTDHLLEPNNLKNNYWLLESLRRILYLDSSVAKKGFLTAEFRDSITRATNRSILYIPAALTVDSVDRPKILAHPFFTDPKKPFHTTEEAYLYFADQFSQAGLGEADLSMALHLYSQKSKKNYKTYLEKYLASGIGLYKDFADKWMNSGTPNMSFNKRLTIFDNTDNSDNYYLTIRKKQMFNKMISGSFAKDSALNHLVMINELYGSRPKLLHQYQKLMNLVFTLCDVPDVSQWEESTPTRSNEPLPEKNLLVLAPEWYSWLNENKYGKICIDKVSYDNYREDGPLDEVEYESFYQVIDLDLTKNLSRYQQASAQKFKRKQTTAEIVRELQKFIARSDEPD